MPRTLPLALPAKIHSFRLRYAPCKAAALLKVTLGKSVILPRFITLFWVQRHAACRNARRARSRIVVHFTRSFVAQRFKSAFHVFAKAKTFHFSAFDMFAFDHICNAEKFHTIYLLMPDICL